MNWPYHGPRQNKANFRPNRHGSGPATLPAPAAGLIVLNKANLPYTDRQGRGLVGLESLPPLGTIAPNKANSPQSDEKGKYCVEKEL